MRKNVVPPPSASLVAVRQRAQACFHDSPVERLPLFLPFVTGAITRADALRVARQIEPVVEAFPRFLGALLANDLAPELRDTVVDNLYEEQGRMDPSMVHVTTYRRLVADLGGNASARASDRPSVGVLAYVRAMLDLGSRARAAEGAAALAVVEDHVARASLIVGRWLAHADRTLKDAHFGVHEVLDLRHADELYALAAHYWDRGQTAEVDAGLAMGTYLHRRLWADVHAAVFAS